MEVTEASGDDRRWWEVVLRGCGGGGGCWRDDLAEASGGDAVVVMRWCREAVVMVSADALNTAWSCQLLPGIRTQAHSFPIQATNLCTKDVEVIFLYIYIH